MELLAVILFSMCFSGLVLYSSEEKAHDLFFVRISHLLQSIIKYFMIEKMTLVYRYDF